MHLLKEPHYAYAHYYIHDRLLGHVYGLFTPLFKVLWGDFKKFFLKIWKHYCAMEIISRSQTGSGKWDIFFLGGSEMTPRLSGPSSDGSADAFWCSQWQTINIALYLSRAVSWKLFPPRLFLYVRLCNINVMSAAVDTCSFLCISLFFLSFLFPGQCVPNMHTDWGERSALWAFSLSQRAVMGDVWLWTKP